MQRQVKVRTILTPVPTRSGSTGAPSAAATTSAVSKACTIDGPTRSIGGTMKAMASAVAYALAASSAGLIF